MKLLKTAYNAVVWTLALITMMPLGCLLALFSLFGEIAKLLDQFGYYLEGFVKKRLFL